MNKQPYAEQATQICTRHGITVNDLKQVIGSFEKKIYLINNLYVLRISENPMEVEQEKFRRVSSLPNVPIVQHTGVIQQKNSPLYYTMLTLIPGDDFVNANAGTTQAQQQQLGKDIAIWLDSLHAIRGNHYDIGLYVAAIPNFVGTWQAGHQQYWTMLEQDADALALKSEDHHILKDAFQFLRSHADVLDFQNGSSLLHNDFHPKNTLLHQGKFSGVIDWECSQYGEADFELCHYIHWCTHPPESNIDYRPFLRGLFQAAPQCTQVPQLAQRLTLYQIEHEIQKIIWNGNAAAKWRIPKLQHWMAGGVDDLLRQIT